MKRLTKVLIVAAVSLFLMAAERCQSFERSARDAVVTYGGFVRKAQSNHLEECVAFTSLGKNLGKSDAVCPAITKAIAAHNIAVDALNTYCASESYDLFGGKCVANKALQPKLEAALANLSSIIAELKRIGVGQ